MHTMSLLFAAGWVAAGCFAIRAAAQVNPLPAPYTIIPNDSLRVWKSSPQIHNAPCTDPTGAMQVLCMSREGRKEAIQRRRAYRAAAIDPGILIYPDERRRPAGVVIIPQHDVDPRMLVDPDPEGDVVHRLRRLLRRGQK